MAALEIRRRMKGLLLFLPNMVALCGRLMVDARVPRTEKALVAGAVIYAIMPLDFIPDFIPFVGQVDDIYLVSLTLLRLMNRTDDGVVREHWRGGGDIVQLLDSVAGIAPLMLPKRVRRVLSSTVEDRSEGKMEAILSVVRSEPLLVEKIEESPQLEGSDQDGGPKQ
jgi:uncharacterized membrane protein YkvA (DUF1232 family)